MLRNKILIITAAASAIIASSCNKQGNKDSFLWGKTNCYDNFLWKKYVPDTLKQTLCFDFNEDAQNYMSEPLKLGVFKKEPNNQLVRVQSDEMELFVNGQKQDGNVITVPSNVKELEVGVVFNKDAEDKVHYWYVKPVDNGGLERINDRPTEEMTSDDAIMELKAKKNHVMNPLAEGLLFALIIITIAIVLWLLVLKTIFFPTFRVHYIDMEGPEPYFSKTKIKNFHKLILTNKQHKQNWFEQVFVGKTKYSVNDMWTKDVVFEPKDKRSIRIRPDKEMYMIDSRTIKTNNEYVLENLERKVKTKIRIS